MQTSDRRLLNTLLQSHLYGFSPFLHHSSGKTFQELLNLGWGLVFPSQILKHQGSQALMSDRNCLALISCSSCEFIPKVKLRSELSKSKSTQVLPLQPYFYRPCFVHRFTVMLSPPITYNLHQKICFCHQNMISVPYTKLNVNKFRAMKIHNQIMLDV